MLKLQTHTVLGIISFLIDLGWHVAELDKCLIMVAWL